MTVISSKRNPILVKQQHTVAAAASPGSAALAAERSPYHGQQLLSRLHFCAVTTKYRRLPRVPASYLAIVSSLIQSLYMLPQFRAMVGSSYLQAQQIERVTPRQTDSAESKLLQSSQQLLTPQTTNPLSPHAAARIWLLGTCLRDP